MREPWRKSGANYVDFYQTTKSAINRYASFQPFHLGKRLYRNACRFIVFSFVALHKIYYHNYFSNKKRTTLLNVCSFFKPISIIYSSSCNLRLRFFASAVELHRLYGNMDDFIHNEFYTNRSPLRPSPERSSKAHAIRM